MPLLVVMIRMEISSWYALIRNQLITNYLWMVWILDIFNLLFINYFRSKIIQTRFQFGSGPKI